jgi:hypothetical protein
MIYVISNHDARWLDFDRNPAIDEKTRLPYNLAETPPAHLTATSRLSPDFNELSEVHGVSLCALCRAQ